MSSKCCFWRFSKWKSLDGLYQLFSILDHYFTFSLSNFWCVRSQLTHHQIPGCLSIAVNMPSKRSVKVSPRHSDVGFPKCSLCHLNVIKYMEPIARIGRSADRRRMLYLRNHSPMLVPNIKDAFQSLLVSCYTTSVYVVHYLWIDYLKDAMQFA